MRRAVVGVVGIIAALVVVGDADAATLRSLVNEGNERYSGEEFDEALARYRLAVEEHPESFHAYFNLGAALYRVEEMTQAVGAFQSAAQLAREDGDEPNEALARYNLGNAFFRSSDADARTNPRAAIETLEKAVESYRRALELDPALEDARHNIALARKRMKALLEAMQNLPQGGESQDDDQQLQDQIEQNIRKQNELTQQREEVEQQQQQQQSSPQEVERKSEELAEQQKQLEQQSRELAEQLDKPQSSPQQQQAREQLERAAEQQQRAAEQMGEQQLQQAEGPQQQARQNLENALAALGGDPDEAQQQQQTQQQASSRPQQTQQQLQALEQSPQDILNEERANRQRRRMLLLGAQTQVERDW